MRNILKNGLSFVLAFLMAVSSVIVPIFAESLTGITEIDISQYEKIYFQCLTSKGAAEYEVGEEMVFTLTLYADGEQISAPYFKYVIKGDDGSSTSGFADASSGTVELKTKVTKPGAVRIEVSPAGSDKKVISGSNITKFEGGAIAGASEISTTYPEPDNFDEFWEGKLAELDECAPDIYSIEKVSPPNANQNYDWYIVKVNCIGKPEMVATNATYTAGVLTVPKNADRGTLSFKLVFQGYGVKKVSGAAYSKTVCFTVNAHSIDQLMEDDYYNEEKLGLTDYAFSSTENADPNNAYLTYMLLRDVQAVRFLKKYFGEEGGEASINDVNGEAINTGAWKGLWNGETIETQGSSQGGFQAIGVAALDSDVSYVKAVVPWHADVAGNTDPSRIQSSFRPTYAEGLRYLDTALLAKRVKAVKVEITGGTGDTLCPMYGVQAVYNNLNVDSATLTFKQGYKHSATNSVGEDSTQEKANISGEVASGSFANDAYPGATWTYSLDADGTLTIGGTGNDGNTVFAYGGNYDAAGLANIPWGKTGELGGVKIKKVIIPESTGITEIGSYSLAYLKYMESLQIPSTVKTLGTSFPSSEKLRSVYIAGNEPVDNYIDFSNITKIGSYLSDGGSVGLDLTVELNPNLNLKGSSFDTYKGFRWFKSANSLTFKLKSDSAAYTRLLVLADNQNNPETRDSAYPANIKFEFITEELANGNFANANYPNATWTWSFHDDGTLYIGGSASDGSTEFYYGGDASTEGKKYIPWLNGTLNRNDITKVVIAEDTGITSLGLYSLYNLEYAKEIVIPATVTKLNTHCFRNHRRLETISVHGKTDAGKGIYDLRNITSMGQAFRDAAGADYVSGPIEIWYGDGTITFPKLTANWYMPTTSVIFRVVEGSIADTALSAFVTRQKAETGYDTSSTRNVEMAYFETSEEPEVPQNPTSGQDTVNGNYSWEFDTASGTLTFTKLKSSCQFVFDDSANEFFAWVELWRNDIKHIIVPDFTIYKLNTNNYDHPFANLPNLETVKWDVPAIQSMTKGKTKGMFYGCEKLTTFGSSETFEDGVINLSGLAFQYTSATNYAYNMFYGCKSIKKVVFGNAVYLSAMDVTGKLDFIVGKSMFEGCTALESVEFEKVEGLLAGAFKNCTSLKGEITYLGNPEIADAFKGCGGVIIHTDDAAKAAAMLASMQNAGVDINDAMVSCMAHGGFAVRIAGYNGLRSFYSFVGETNVNFDGLTLVEYGSVLGAVENYQLYTKDIGGENSIFTLDKTNFEFKTPEKIIKTAIYIAEGYTGKLAEHRKINEDGSVEFVVTITNFTPAMYNRGVIMNGYEIWMDNDGNYTVIFTEYPNDDYKVNTLYKTTMGMLIDGVIDIGAENSPVYNVINSAEKTVFDCGNENVTSFLVPHHIKTGKKIAVYSYNGEENLELNGLGIPAAELANVADYAFSGNIKFELPRIDGYWKDHITDQLASLPEGKSFIAITDTHYPDNAGKSADLIQYVRKITGIEKVINLGDPYSGEDTYEEALSELERSMEEKFFDYFGEDGLYAIGNHDSNTTKSRNTVDDNDQTYFMDILLSDKEIYEHTFAHIENGGEKNKNIVYNEKLLSLIEENKNDIEAFVLDNVSAEDATSNNNLFGNVNYSAEEMYENLVCWAKMHYAYYDHENEICYLVLNTGALTVTDFATLNRETWKFHPSQYDFIEKILREVAEDYSTYDIVVAGHMLYDSDVPGDGHIDDFHSILSAFRAGTSVTVTGKGNNPLSGKLFGCEDGATSRTLSYDFTDVDFAGNIFCITGHIHKDIEVVTQTDDAGVKYTSVSYDSVKDNISDNAILCLLLEDDNAEKFGTIDEHAFTIFTVTEENTLVATRIGRKDGGWSQKTYNLG